MCVRVHTCGEYRAQQWESGVWWVGQMMHKTFVLCDLCTYCDLDPVLMVCARDAGASEQ